MKSHVAVRPRACHGRGAFTAVGDGSALDLAPAVLLFFPILFSELSSHLLSPLAPPVSTALGSPPVPRLHAVTSCCFSGCRLVPRRLSSLNSTSNNGAREGRLASNIVPLRPPRQHPHLCPSHRWGPWLRTPLLLYARSPPIVKTLCLALLLHWELKVPLTALHSLSPSD